MRSRASGAAVRWEWRRSLACFLYCSRLGRAGSCLSDIRSSFRCSPGVRTRQAGKKIRQIVETGGGHGPFRGLDAPFALEISVKRFGIEVNLSEAEWAKVGLLPLIRFIT